MKYPILSTIFASVILIAVTSASGADAVSKTSKSTSKYSLDAKVNSNSASRIVSEMSSIGESPKNDIIKRIPLETTKSDEQKLLFLRLKRQSGDGSLTLHNYQFGYGQVMDYERTMLTCSNAAGWEEPSCVFVKYCMNF